MWRGQIGKRSRQDRSRRFAAQPVLYPRGSIAYGFPMKQGWNHYIIVGTLLALIIAKPTVFAQLETPATLKPEERMPMHKPAPRLLPAVEPARVLDIGLHSGLVDYQETVSIDPTSSDWRSGFVGLDATLRYNKDQLRANFSGDFWYSFDAEEEWRFLGFLAQRNDMNVYGLDWLAEVGYQMDPQGEASITPYIGLGYRFQEFSRNNFDLFRDGFGDLGRVNETFDLFLINGAVELENRLSPQSLLNIRADLGVIFVNQAVNTAIPGTLEGDGGFVFKVEGLWRLEISPNQSFQLGVYVEHQENNGSVETRKSTSGEDFIVEWPDNDLERFGIRAAFEINI
jgi:hypothetical protein